ncbi:MAG: hypothetical protein GY720_07375 [bacterium]|nr:hypothetical protein [bacterium]
MGLTEIDAVDDVAIAPSIANAADEVDLSGDLVGMDLAGANLAGRDLSGRDLSHADLTGADLSNCRLIGTRLVNATLVEANLECAQFLGADLTGADMTDAEAFSVVFGSSNLTDAVLFNATLNDATFAHADLTRADLRTANLEEARLRDATLVHADLSGAQMAGTDLSRARIGHAIFRNADLSRAKLRAVRGYSTTDWIGIEMPDANFGGAYIVRRQIIDENYLYEFRHKSQWHKVIYHIWSITSDCGRSFLRWVLWTAILALLFGIAYTYIDIDYGDYETVLSPLYYSVVTMTTLGYGDALPASMTGQIVAMAQVVIGYMTLGGVLSIFATKMGRRAE